MKQSTKKQVSAGNGKLDKYTIADIKIVQSFLAGWSGNNTNDMRRYNPVIETVRDWERDALIYGSYRLGDSPETGYKAKEYISNVLRVVIDLVQAFFTGVTPQNIISGKWSPTQQKQHEICRLLHRASDVAGGYDRLADCIEKACNAHTYTKHVTNGTTPPYSISDSLQLLNALLGMIHYIDDNTE